MGMMLSDSWDEPETFKLVMLSEKRRRGEVRGEIQG